MRIMIKKSVANEICRYWGLPLVRKSLPMDAGTAYYKKRILEMIKERLAIERAKSGKSEKSLAMLEKANKPREKATDGAIRTWGNGKKYRRIAPGKWRRVYEEKDQGSRVVEKTLTTFYTAVDAFSGSDDELDKLVDQFLWQFKDEAGMPLSWVPDFKAQARQAKAEGRSLMQERKEARRQARNAKAREARGAKRGAKPEPESEAVAEPLKGDGGTGYTARLRKELLENLTPYFNNDVENEKTGVKARLSSNSVKKICCDKAIQKSKDNGFKVGQHFKIANEILELYKRADFVEQTVDRNNDPNVKSMLRFQAPISVDGKEGFAYITVKEAKVEGKRIYSLELTEINKAPLKNEASNAAENSETVAPKHTHIDLHDTPSSPENASEKKPNRSLVGSLSVLKARLSRTQKQIASAQHKIEAMQGGLSDNAFYLAFKAKDFDEYYESLPDSVRESFIPLWDKIYNLKEVKDSLERTKRTLENTDLQDYSETIQQLTLNIEKTNAAIENVQQKITSGYDKFRKEYKDAKEWASEHNCKTFGDVWQLSKKERIGLKDLKKYAENLGFVVRDLKKDGRANTLNEEGKVNVLDTEGRLLCSEWMDFINTFHHGIANVGKDGKRNFIDKWGNLISDVWLDDVLSVDDYHNSSNGRSHDEYGYPYDYAFVNGYAHVVNNGKKMYMDRDGKFYRKLHGEYVEIKHKDTHKSLSSRLMLRKSVARAILRQE